ncbi:hypothetical protein [Enterococcus hirae]|uniref:hypothetical protein n=1 Tax=Enterococcus hirae TaxID=1354 RepID=UPI00196267F7|nr:hypothetical protein [Enterococcus hirae]MBV6971904.1 hypothetical protein [Enterococcus hirae]MBZ3624227.1 hypothetical protein [Enterococcus hirae]MCL4597018.1 hypothetical protein [Enterococcus hirae]MDT2621471.1 hypothetical protein [Enterococcus hirae]MDT2624601.1 hypothetical protein [Enterococcus hirae]
MDKFTSKTVQGNGEKAKVTANIQENAEVKDQKEVNSNMPFIQQKIEEIFTLQWGIQEVEQKLEQRLEQELAAKQSFISLCKKNQNQNIEEISNKFNELNKTSGIVNPIPTFINQKLEETFLLNKRILEIHDTTEIDSKSKKSMIENLENSKDKLMDQLIKKVSEEFNELRMDKSISETVQGNDEKAEVIANIQENAEVKDQKEVNSPNNLLKTSGTVNTNMPFIQQKIEEIFTSQWGIQAIGQKGEQVLNKSRFYRVTYFKNQKNQNIEEISNKFNELNKTSGIVNPIPTFINQKLEETFLLNKRILEIHDTTEIDSKSKKSMIENLENSKDKLMDQLIKEVSEEFNKLTKEQSKQTLRSMKEIQKVKNTRQNPLSKRANSSPQKAEPDQKKSR